MLSVMAVCMAMLAACSTGGHGKATAAAKTNGETSAAAALSQAPAATATKPAASDASNTPGEAGRGTEYTNMTGQAAKAQLEELLTYAGIDETKDYIASLDAFNSIMPASAGLKDGMTPGSQKKYDLHVIGNAWTDKYQNKNDLNCRLAVFQLMQDKVSAKKTTDYGNYLMFDVDALDNDARFKALDAKKSEFIALFDQISVKSIPKEKYAETYAKALKSRGVKYNDGKASIISVLMHDPDEDTLFVGHAGVMIEKDGYVWFLEKLAPTEPYQLTRYPDEAALKKDLLTRTGYAESGSDKPVLLKNDAVFK